MLQSILNNQLRNVDLGLLVIRLFGGGFMLAQHGLPKFRRILNGDFQFADPIGIGPELSLILITFAEFVCAILIIVGLKSRLASIPLMFAMLVAAFIHHADDPFGRKEFALLYFVIFLVIFLMGSGRMSLDEKLSS